VIKETKAIKVHLVLQVKKAIRVQLVLQETKEIRVQQVNGGPGVHLEIKVLQENQVQ
jgi:hypothetical protein